MRKRKLVIGTGLWSCRSMSQAPQLGRTDKAMTDERVEDVIQRCAYGGLATDAWSNSSTS